MKTKNNYLIWCVLFIFLMLPFQFACNEENDELQPLQTEEQATIDEHGVALAPPLLPETGPDGKPIDYSNMNNSKGGLSIEKIVITDRLWGVTNELDCWDTKLYHEIHPYNIYQSGNIWYMHYINIPGKGWVGTGWRNANTSRPQTSYYSWNVSFHEGDVIQSYGYTWRDGVSTGKWGPTITVEAPETPGDAGWTKLCSDAVKLVVKSCIQGLKGTWFGWAKFVTWGITGDGLYNDCVNFYVCDQDGNPLHAQTGPENTFLGVSMVDDADRSLGTKGIICKEPDGPGSWDDNLYGQQVNIDLSEYDNNDLWGTTEDNIPTVIVVFNTNGTHQVLKPGTPFKDSRDGQVYNTVKIGNQTWMAENLNYNCSGSYCYNNDPANGDIYGRLYSWNAAMTAAPAGWHLPTKEEWTTLINYLGGTGVAGGKMKEIGTEHWDSPNTGATNESGFTALGSGRSFSDSGGGIYLGERAYFWSATAYNSPSSYNCSLNYNYDNAYYLGFCPKNYNIAVRCVKN